MSALGCFSAPFQRYKLFFSKEAEPIWPSISRLFLLPHGIPKKAPSASQFRPKFRLSAACAHLFDLARVLSPPRPGLIGLGPLILGRMEQGESAKQALGRVIAGETDARLRQLGVVDAKGGSAAYTGRNTDGWAGHQTGVN